MTTVDKSRSALLVMDFQAQHPPDASVTEAAPAHRAHRRALSPPRASAVGARSSMSSLGFAPGFQKISPNRSEELRDEWRRPASSSITTPGADIAPALAPARR